MKRNEKWKKCLTSESKRANFNIWCDELTQHHKKTFKSFKNIFAMRRMQSKNLKFKKRNINRSRRSQNAKRNRKLQIYWRNEVIHAKTNESLHQCNNAKEKSSKTQLTKKKKKRKNTNIKLMTQSVFQIQHNQRNYHDHNRHCLYQSDENLQTWMIYWSARKCERASFKNDFHTQLHRRHSDAFDALETSSMILRLHESRL